MKTLKENIITLFYIEHLKVKEIAEKVNTSSAYITKIIKQDTRYIQEKEYRKAISKDKRKVAQNNFIKNKREKQKIDDNYSFVQSQHEFRQLENYQNQNHLQRKL